MRKRSLLLFTAAAAALAVPATAGAAQPTTRGIVVQRDARGGAVVLATRSGNLKRIALAKPNRLAMGSIVQVRGAKISVVGHSRKAKLHGVVMRRSQGAYALAGNGSVLAIATATPPAAGQQITATVQVSANALSDDDGQVEVEDSQAPGAEVRGTVLSQTDTTLVLTVPGFPSGLTIALGTQTIPVLAAGTPVEAHVTLAPDPANAAGIILTLVSLRTESSGHGDHHGSSVKAEGTVSALVEGGDAGGADGSITIAGEHGDVTFAIPAGFGPTGVAVGDTVEAKGAAPTVAGGLPTLLRLEAADDNSGDSQGDGDGGSQNGDGGSGSED